MADTSNILTNSVIFSTLDIQTYTPFAVDPLKKMACVMSVYFETGRSKLKIAKELNDLADLAKWSYKKSNEFLVTRKCEQNVAADDRIMMYWTKQCYVWIPYIYNKSVMNQRCVYNKLMLQWD